MAGEGKTVCFLISEEMKIRSDQLSRSVKIAQYMRHCYGQLIEELEKNPKLDPSSITLVVNSTNKKK